MVLADVFHIATLKNPLNQKVGFCIVIDFFKINIPENAFFKYRILLCVQVATIIKTGDAGNK